MNITTMRKNTEELTALIAELVAEHTELTGHAPTAAEQTKIERDAILMLAELRTLAACWDSFAALGAPALLEAPSVAAAHR